MLSLTFRPFFIFRNVLIRVPLSSICIDRTAPTLVLDPMRSCLCLHATLRGWRRIHREQQLLRAGSCGLYGLGRKNKKNAVELVTIQKILNIQRKKETAVGDLFLYFLRRRRDVRRILMLSAALHPRIRRGSTAVMLASKLDQTRIQGSCGQAWRGQVWREMVWRVGEASPKSFAVVPYYTNA